MIPNRVNAGGLAKGRSGGWHSRSSEASSRSEVERLLTRNGIVKKFEFTTQGAMYFDVMACAAGRSSVQEVPRTADVKLSKSTAFCLVFIVEGTFLVF